MTVELQINKLCNRERAVSRLVAFSLSNPDNEPVGSGEPPSVTLEIRGNTQPGGGQIAFRTGTTGAFANSVTVNVPTDGSTVPFFVAGKFGLPSSSTGDVSIEVRSGATLIASVPVMVRVRKNANTLSASERDRFVAAFAKLNDQGLGRFKDFRDMHVRASLSQAHGAPGFLPWHRAYILDLERDLQAIDQSVALPYWRFDQPARNLFTVDFFGQADQNGNCAVQVRQIRSSFWRTDGDLGVNRQPDFPTSQAPPGLLNQLQTLALGGSARAFALFRTMEVNPHGYAHTSFTGSIQDPATAPKDPLFFLLHCNVDRLWALWQRKYNRFDPSAAASFDSKPTNPLGHKLPDTMWPWNGATGGTRPPTAPGGPMSASPCVNAPGTQPRVEDMLDYQGVIGASSVLGYDYDDALFA